MKMSPLKERRAAEWDSTFIPCRNHKDRKCKRFKYVDRGLKTCSTCFNRLSVECRKKKWDSEFIPCIKHEDRKCARSWYIRIGARKCGSCAVRHPDGSLRASFRRHKAKTQRKMGYNKSAERRKRNGLQHNRTLRGLELFGRISGFPVKSLGLVIAKGAI